MTRGAVYPAGNASSGSSLGPRVHRGTLLEPGPSEGWASKLYEDAGEAVIWREIRVKEDVTRLRPEVARTSEDRAADNRERAISRARSAARKYAAHNQTTRLVTFTYETGSPCLDCAASRPRHDCRTCRRRIKRDYGDFARRLHRAGYRVPWLRSIEPHDDGSGHVHAAMAWEPGWQQERQQRTLAGLWGHGFVDVAKGRRGSQKLGQREMARVVARYVVKYAVKDIESGILEPGEHAYEVAQGFQPIAIRARAWTRALAVDGAIEMMGGEVPRYQWESEDCESWRGPPVTMLGW